MAAPAVLIESVQKLLRRNAEKNLAKILERTHEADIAILMRQLPDPDKRRIWELVPEPLRRAEVLAEADPEIQEVLLAAIDDDELLRLLQELSGDDAADILEILPEERAARILQVWKDEEGAEVNQLLGYSPDTAGGIMSPHVFALEQHTTARQAIEALQANPEAFEIAFYLYVINEHGHLVGVCSLRQLVVSAPDAPLSSFMATDVTKVEINTDQEDVARLVARYNLLAVPVTDTTNRLVGVITVDDVIDVIREEATEDIFMMAGAGAVDFSEQQSALRNARVRMPWLLATFIGGTCSMFVVKGFDDQLQQVSALAAFIPITLGMGGNVGTQAATIMTRGIALGRINAASFRSVVLREVGTGSLLGFAYGILLGTLVSLLYGGDPAATYSTFSLALTVGASICFSMTIAATVGGAVPILFHRVGIDPAIATGPVVTTGVDLVGITTYFVIASTILGL